MQNRLTQLLQITILWVAGWVFLIEGDYHHQIVTTVLCGFIGAFVAYYWFGVRQALAVLPARRREQFKNGFVLVLTWAVGGLVIIDPSMGWLTHVG